MDKKITRRVAIGSAFGALVAGTVGTIYFRTSRSPIFEEIDPYGKLIVPPKIDSDLAADDLAKAFKVFQKEREMWLNFRGVSAQIKIVKETTAADGNNSKKVADEGWVSLNLDLKPIAGIARKMLAPADVKLIYSDAKNSAPVWSFVMAKRDPRKPGKFTGKEINSINHIELYSFLTLPLSLLSADNGTVKEISSFWKVSRNIKPNSGSDSYVFESNGKPISDGLLPTFGFTDGHFSGFIPKRMPGQSYSTIALMEHIVENGVAYPTAIVISHAAKSDTLPVKTVTTITLSDVQITTT